MKPSLSLSLSLVFAPR
uniref:BabB n=1 Tax=Helicobacter pylori TaxID=210 RepID=A0A0N7ELF5_HELPX|nr:BabB [Helicobacter pylori]